MGCNCGQKSQKKLSQEATRMQAQLEQARKEAQVKKQTTYAAPSPAVKK